ncbi:MULTISPECIES: VIT domain-containing protein [unclassified Microcoleus]|uniref:VIT domain-containing protein n=1 Tax=unclassified Microcoleus TaxID=2642155 RepID=UPI002FD7485D
MPSSTSPTERTSGLYVRSPEGEQIVFPLKHTEVRAKIAGNLSRVEVSQKFENPFTKPLEAVYIFPLPAEAAVDEMEIKIGDRTIKGSIKKREEAQRIYEKAKQEGRTAGLLEQERDNIFTQSLANIKPGEEIEVTIRYTDSLKFLAGDYEFVFPMVVGPRYIPGTPLDETTASGSAPAPMTVNSSTDIVPDASRLNAPILPPGMRSGHDIGVTLEIEAGVPIRNVNSPSHKLQIEYFDSPQTSPSSEEKNGMKVCVQLGNADTIPNKDLIVRYHILGRETQSTVLTQSDARGGHFAVYLIPAIEYKTDEIVPKDVVFLVDTSGSQAGAPLQQCQALLRQFINGLNPADTFSILDFSNSVRQLSTQPLPNTAENRQMAIAHINKLCASGATEMLGGIRAAIDFPAPSGRLRNVVFLSDGYIGNENQVLAEVQQHLKPGNRLYSFGAGSSVNRFLLDRIAEIGRGFSRIVTHDEPVNEFVEKFFRQINNPVLVNLEITWQGEGENPVIYPSIAPDLFAEQPLVLFGKKGDRQAGTLQIKGVSAGGHQYVQTYEMNFTDPGNPALAQLWGRHRIKDLMNQMVQYETKVGVETVTETALTYQLLSQYTAFVAVSDDVRVEPGTESIAMNLPVEMPEAVEYGQVFESVSLEDLRAARTGMSYLGSLDTGEELERGISLPARVFEGSRKERSICYSPSAPPSAELSPIVQQVKVVIATGLDRATIASLNKHLQVLTFPGEFNGELALEIIIRKGRITRILVNEDASTVTDAEVIKEIKRSLFSWLIPGLIKDIERSLFSWLIPGFVKDTVKLTLQVRS